MSWNSSLLDQDIIDLQNQINTQLGPTGPAGQSFTGPAGPAGTGSTGFTGATGSQGNSLSYFQYVANTLIQNPYPPPTGVPATNILWDSPTQTSSTVIYLSDTNSENIDITVFLSMISAGNDILIQDSSNSDNYQIWTIGGPIQNIVNYFAFNGLTLVSSGGTGTTNFPNATNLIISALTIGSVGATGPVGPQGNTGPRGNTGNTGPVGGQVNATYQPLGTAVGNTFTSFSALCTYLSNFNPDQQFTIYIDTTYQLPAIIPTGTYALPPRVMIQSLSTTTSTFQQAHINSQCQLTGLSELYLKNITLDSNNSGGTSCITLNATDFYLNLYSSSLFGQDTGGSSFFKVTNGATLVCETYGNSAIYANPSPVFLGDSTSMTYLEMYDQSSISAGAASDYTYGNFMIYANSDVSVDPSYFPAAYNYSTNVNFTQTNFVTASSSQWTSHYGTVPVYVNTALDLLASGVGATGYTGNTGQRGPTGFTGPNGISYTGSTGSTGNTGANGVSYTGYTGNTSRGSLVPLEYWSKWHFIYRIDRIDGKYGRKRGFVYWSHWFCRFCFINKYANFNWFPYRFGINFITAKCWKKYIGC